MFKSRIVKSVKINATNTDIKMRKEFKEFSL